MCAGWTKYSHLMHALCYMHSQILTHFKIDSKPIFNLSGMLLPGNPISVIV